MVSIEVFFYGEPFRSPPARLIDRLYFRLFQPIWAHTSISVERFNLDPYRSGPVQLRFDYYAFRERRPDYSVVFQIEMPPEEAQRKFAKLLKDWRFNILTGKTCSSFCREVLSMLGGPRLKGFTPDILWDSIKDTHVLTPLESSKEGAYLTFLATERAS